MRYILLTILFFSLAAVIKIDLQEGTLPLAAFYPSEACTEIEAYEWTSITVRVQQRETIHSLFATTPTAATYPERLVQFYKINPHLQQQSLLKGTQVKLPILQKITNSCNN